MTIPTDRKSPGRPLQRKATILDVARRCGLAPSTVSNALAYKDIVRPETQRLVHRVAKELGYHASPIARSLRLGKTWSIGMILSDITNPFHGEVIRGAEDVLAETGYNLFLANTDYDEKKQSHHVQQFIERQADGVVLMSYSADTMDVERLVNAGIPVLLLLRRHKATADIPQDYCGVKNDVGMKLALSHLHQLGHRRIGFINGPLGSSAAAERLEAYRDFMHSIGEFDPDLVQFGSYSIETGRSMTIRMLHLPRPPTAIIGAEDMIALGVMTTAAETGLRVPQDLSVVGWDDLFVAGIPQVNLTTVRVPKWELGVNAARLIQRRIAQPGSSAETILVRPELIVRGTTGPCPAPP